tara:strand:+ start:1295 stop:1879 length:585 start_codon:yes stop_codon:yes gene_type:complete
MFTIKFISLNKFNEKYELVQKNKPNNNELIDILNLKLPTIITGEVEEWFIYNKNDKIDKEKLNHKTLQENCAKLIYILPIVRKYNINSFKKNYFTNILLENNTKHFLVLLEGSLEIKLFNPLQKDLIKKNNTIYSKNPNNEAKFINIKLHSEQILYIPLKWYYSYKCSSDCLLLDIYSETLLTLPIKNIMQSLN